MAMELHMIEILLVEDNPGDTDLARESLVVCKIKK